MPTATDITWCYGGNDFIIGLVVPDMDCCVTCSTDTDCRLTCTSCSKKYTDFYELRAAARLPH